MAWDNYTSFAMKNFELAISDKLLEIFQTINNATLGTIVATLGIAANLVNMAVFLKQGFKDTVNISLFALALADLCSLLTLQLANLFRNPLFVNSVPVLPMEAQHLTAGWPHAFFTRLAGAITAYTTLERCFCVLIPLKVKNVFTPKLSIIVLTIIFIVFLLTVVPDYTISNLGWKYDVGQNRTVLGLIFKAGAVELTSISFTLGCYFQLILFLAVVLFTATLVIKLREQSKWRASTAHSGSHSIKSKTTRETRAVIMIALIAGVYCVCFLPYIVNNAVSTIIPDFGIARRYNNAFCAAWSFAFFIDGINSSLNTLVYYRMSSKFRDTFHQLFTCCPRPAGRLKKQDSNWTDQSKQTSIG